MKTVYDHALDVIEERRKVLGMSKAELARRCDMNDTVLSRKIFGARMMTADELLKLTYAMSIPLHAYYSVPLEDLPQSIHDNAQ